MGYGNVPGRGNICAKSLRLGGVWCAYESEREPEMSGVQGQGQGGWTVGGTQ